jgi:hypothetical protein
MTAHGPQIEISCAVIDRASKESKNHFSPLSNKSTEEYEL